MDAKTISAATCDSFLSNAVGGICGALTAAGGPVLSIFAGAAGTAVSERLLSYHRSLKANQKTELRKLCEPYIPSNLEEKSELIITTVEICLEHLSDYQTALHEGWFNSLNTVPEDKIKHWINEYLRTNPDLEFLSPFLPEILHTAVSAMQNSLLENMEFMTAAYDYIMAAVSKVDKLTSLLPDSAARHSPYDVEEEYYQAWTKSMFLHRDSKLPLCQLYQPPTFFDSNYSSLKSRLQAIIDHSDDLDHLTERALLVLGQPGSGKSTLITYLLHSCIIPQDRTVRVFRFRSMKGIDWNGDFETLPIDILDAVRLSEDDLNHSVLILDGLDEVNMAENHIVLLNVLMKKWVQSRRIRDFSLLVTCRESRIETSKIYQLDFPHLTLPPMNSHQIRTFTRRYCQITGESREFKLNDSDPQIHAVLGIPIILYMLLATGIDIGHSTSMVDIYQKLFSLDDRKHSIYFRPQENLTVDDTLAEQIHEFSKQAAVAMWEHHPEEAILEHERCEKIVESIPNGSSLNLHDLMTGQYFIEGADGSSICFVHRSIYEYFVAISVTDTIQKMYDSGLTPKQLFSDEHLHLLGRFADLIGMQDLVLSQEIMTNIIYLLEHLYQPLNEFCSWWEDFFVRFLPFGLADAASRHKGGPIGMMEEGRRCMNIFQVTFTLHHSLGRSKPYAIIPDKISLQALCRYQAPANRYVPWDDLSLEQMNLSVIQLYRAFLATSHLAGADLTHANLWDADLRSADLTRSDLKNADLRSADLTGADLTCADLTGAHLTRADLTRADLTGAILKDAVLTHAVLTHATLKGAILKGAVLTVADLTNANLTGTDLRNVILISADLRGAWLPDGFQSNNQEEQIEHLKSMNIPGLRI